MGFKTSRKQYETSSAQPTQIFLLSQHHFKENNFLKIPKYSTITTNRQECIASGGTSVSFRSNSIRARPDLHSNEESSWVEINRNSRKNILFASVYLPPDRNQFLEGLAGLKETLKQAKQEDKHIVLCGDWNARSHEFGDSEDLPTS